MIVYNKYINNPVNYLYIIKIINIMTVKYLKHMQKWCVIYKGKARGIGNTPSQAISQACDLIKNYENNTPRA